MSVDRTKALKAAQKHLAKGALDKAIAEYEKVVADDPSDARTLLKLGDIYTRKGASKEAAGTYRKVAEQYAEQGFFLKAVAVYKQILKLDPGQLETWEQLAEMYEMLSLISDALTTYEQVVDAYTRNGHADKALRALGKMAELDPENVATAIRYAETLSSAGAVDDAAREFERGAALLKQQGRVEDYIKVTERLLFHTPDNVELARELSAMYLERGDARHALAKLQTCFQADPTDISTLELLAQAFQMLGQTAKTVSVYKEVARLHEGSGRAYDQAQVLRRILEIDPSDAEALAQLPAVQDAQPSIGTGSVSVPVIDIADDDDMIVLDEALDEDEDVLDDDFDDFDVTTSEIPVSAAPSPGLSARPVQGSQGFGASAPPSATEPAVMPTPPPEPEEDIEAQIERLMSECEVFLRYGLDDKVLAQLTNVLHLDPNHLDARAKLKDLFLKMQDVQAAVEQLIALADLNVGSDDEAALAYLHEARQLSPNDGNVSIRLQGLEAKARRPIESQPADEEDDVIMFDDEDEDDDVIMFDDEPLDDDESELMLEQEEEAADGFEIPAARAAAANGARPQIAVSFPPPVSNPPGARGLQSAFPAPPAPAGIGATPSPAPGPLTPPPAMPTGAPGPLSSPLPPPGVLTPPVAPAASAPPAGTLEGPKTAEIEIPEEISEALEEVDFYLSQGLQDEALDSLMDAIEEHGEHPVLLAKRQEIEGGDPGSTADDQSFALAEKLAGETSEPAAAAGASASNEVDVNQVIDQFKQGVAAEVDRNDTATHYDLGIAYMEMGLQAEAIDEFKLCLEDPSRACTSHTMIGLCFVSKGDMPPAIDHFKLALQVPGASDEETLGLWFELGNAHELHGQASDALRWYQKVLEVNPDFRDVQERIERVGVPPSDSQEADDFDAMFDNMILKD